MCCICSAMLLCVWGALRSQAMESDPYLSFRPGATSATPLSLDSTACFLSADGDYILPLPLLLCVGGQSWPLPPPFTVRTAEARTNDGNLMLFYYSAQKAGGQSGTSVAFLVWGESA